MKLSAFYERKLELYNLILAACIDKKTTILAVQKSVDMSQVYLNKHCNILVEKGYLSRVMEITGTFKVRTYFYTTIINEFPVSAMEQRFKTSRKGVTYEPKEVIKPLPCGTIYRSEDRADLYLQQSQQIARERKSPKLQVSGSLGYASW